MVLPLVLSQMVPSRMVPSSGSFQNGSFQNGSFQNGSFQHGWWGLKLFRKESFKARRSCEAPEASLCETPAACRPPGFAHCDRREPKRALWADLGLGRRLQFHERTPKRGKKERNLWWERGKKSDILGGRAEGRSGGGPVRRRASNAEDHSKC